MLESIRPLELMHDTSETQKSSFKDQDLEDNIDVRSGKRSI